MILIDTDIVVHWRDGDPFVRDRIAMLPTLPAISAVTGVELENGVYRDPTQTERRRARTDLLLERLQILDLTAEAAAIFGRIVARTGYSRARTADRMIAATALLHGIPLATMNGRDFRDIPDLQLEVWSSPGVAEQG